MLNKTLVEIRDEYIASRKDISGHSDQYFQNELRKMRKSADEIHDIMIELTDEWATYKDDKERRRVSKTKIIIGGIASLILATTIIVMAIGINGVSATLGTGIILLGFTLIQVMQGANELKRIQINKKRLQRKWENW